MFDSITLDQLRMFVTVAETGSFSAAGRRLGRVQSAVSHAIASLEQTLGVALFDRSTKRPSLTPQGQVLVREAEHVLRQTSQLVTRAASISGGLEPELSIAVDALFPMVVLIATCTEFQEHYPSVGLRLRTETLGAVPELVSTGQCQLGVSTPTHTLTSNLISKPLTHIRNISVAATDHPLARHRAPLPREELARYPQVVISDRSTLTQGKDFGVISPQTWRVADMPTKHELIRAGLGWGALPDHLIAEDLRSGRLAVLESDEFGPQGQEIRLDSIMRTDSPLGPAGQWLLRNLEQNCAKICGSAKNRS